MGVSTVEAHLSQVYRKLAIRSRTELAGADRRDEGRHREGKGRDHPSLGVCGFRACALGRILDAWSSSSSATSPGSSAPISCAGSPGSSGARAERKVRYLGSTIVLGDEACYCEFEGPSEAAVAEANRTVGLPFDRIVPAVTVTPKGEQR